ncbi:MAG: ribulose-phosphate 3-epimerase, partial [Candidatus Neomarinimicrobiota bacterium]|nr:ribulose-phosphate 3-epimerase [Candidatus Neomarinimicrobiota bacterium]
MPQKFRLAPSILSADFVDMKTALKQCADGGAHWIHVDVMDNQFVPNLTIGPPVVKSLRSKTDKFIDVHMMVIDPEKLVEPFAKAGADNITFHIEATDDPDGIIDLIQSFGCKVGISIKPKTPLDDLFPLLDKVDVALVMSVEPGFGGQGYLPGSNERITAIKDYLN